MLSCYHLDSLITGGADPATEPRCGYLGGHGSLHALFPRHAVSPSLLLPRSPQHSASLARFQRAVLCTRLQPG